MVGGEEKAEGVRAQQRSFSYTEGLPGGREQGCASQMVSITSRPQGVVPQTSGGSPGREALSQKRSVGVDLFTRVNLQEIHRRPIKFISAKYQLALKCTQTVRTERGCENPDFAGRKQVDTTTQPQAHANFHEKGKMIQEAEMRAQKAEPRTMQNYAQALKLNRTTPNTCLARFQISTEQ